MLQSAPFLTIFSKYLKKVFSLSSVCAIIYYVYLYLQIILYRKAFHMNATQTERKTEYLQHIHSPEDFQAIPVAELSNVANEIRAELVRITSETGGHLASNLGVVELTMAIHRVFSTPYDHVIFDVGHQSYVHKMLTGRYEQMETLRQSGGISGFTNRTESEHDCFGAGHSSTSLSAALGFAISDRLSGSDAYTVAVVGDGAYTGGMIHEALNNCRKDLNLIIIMNENEMSISKNIGRFASNLSKLRTKSGYFKTKKATGAFLIKLPLIGKPLFRFVRAMKRLIKNLLYGSNYFESMGLTYLGPIDGNDYEAVEKLLREAKKLNESVVLHLKTKKGKGFSPAEESPDVYHGMPPKSKTDEEGQSFSREMGHLLTDLAEQDSRVCAITAAMCDGTGLCEFKERMPSRFFDVGIAEEHALTFGAGLAANGMKPFVAIYSTFLQRGYDSIIHDIALQNLPCVLCVDRAGLNAGDGATHHGIFDVAFLSQIPNLRIYTPITFGALKMAMQEAYESEGPCAIRYPNGYECERVVKEFYPDGVYGVPSAVCNYRLEEDLQVVIVTHGRMAKKALDAVDALRDRNVCAGVILLEVLKPYDITAQTILDLLPSHDCGIVFLEEEIRSGGMGNNLCDQLIYRYEIDANRIRILAVDDSFVEKRRRGEDIYDAAGIGVSEICRTCEDLHQKLREKGKVLL